MLQDATLTARGDPAGPSVQLQPFDLAVLQPLLAAIGRHEFEAILGQAAQQFQAQVDRIRQAFADGDRTSLASLAHGLKGLSATLGAIPLSDACRRLERAARAGDAPDLAKPAADLFEVGDLTIDHARRHFGRSE